MFRTLTSIFFTVLFMAIITAPSIILVVDDSVDVSVFYSLSEEEEEHKSVKLVFSLNQEESIGFDKLIDVNHLVYHFKNYSKPHLNLISPPPDFS